MTLLQAFLKIRDKILNESKTLPQWIQMLENYPIYPIISKFRISQIDKTGLSLQLELYEDSVVNKKLLGKTDFTIYYRPIVCGRNSVEIDLYYHNIQNDTSEHASVGFAKEDDINILRIDTYRMTEHSTAIRQLCNMLEILCNFCND